MFDVATQSARIELCDVEVGFKLRSLDAGTLVSSLFRFWVSRDPWLLRESEPWHSGCAQSIFIKTFWQSDSLNSKREETMDGDHDATDIGDIDASSNPPPEISVPHNYFIKFPPEFQTRLTQVLDGDDNDNFHKILHIFDSINELCTKEPCSLNKFLPVRICDDQSWLRSEISWENPRGDSPDNSMTSQSNILPRQALKKLLTSVARSGRAEPLGMPRTILTNIAGSVHRTPVLNALEDGDSRGMCMLSEGSKKEIQKTCKANVKLPVIPLPESWSKGSVIRTGKVWQVTISQGVFAMKTFKVRELWREEADIVEVLSHPHIVHTFGSTESKDPDNAGSDEFSLVMERMTDDLSGWMLSRKEFNALDSLNVLLQVARAMEYMHGERVVHGDLKPQNILISEFDISKDAEKFIVVKVADFGNAKKVTSEAFIPTKGTTRWSSPEVLRCHMSMDEKLEDPFKADVYSFGLIAYEVLTGQQIFQGLTTSTLQEKIMGSDESLSGHFKQIHDVQKHYSKSFIPFMKRCWAWKPTERPSFREIIEKIKDTKPSMSTSHTSTDKDTTKEKRPITNIFASCVQPHPTLQPLSPLVESQILEDKIERTEKNEEAKKDSVIVKSPKSSTCYTPAIENSNSRSMTKDSTPGLGINGASKKIAKGPKQVVKGLKQGAKQVAKGLKQGAKQVANVVQHTTEGANQGVKKLSNKFWNKPCKSNKDAPLPTQPSSSLEAPLQGWAQEGNTTKRGFEGDASNDGYEQSPKKRRL